MTPKTATAAAPSTANRMAPPVNGTTLPPGALALVVLEGGASVALVTGVGNGAVVDEVKTGVTEAGLEETRVVGGDDDATIAEVGETGAAVLEEAPAAMVWLALKPLGRVMPLSLAQVAGSSPLLGD